MLPRTQRRAATPSRVSRFRITGPPEPVAASDSWKLSRMFAVPARTYVAVAVKTAAIRASARLRSAQARTHSPAAMMTNGNVPRSTRSPGHSTERYCSQLSQPGLRTWESSGITRARTVSTAVVTM